MIVLKDIHLIDNTNANVYVVDLIDKLLIIDTGLPGMDSIIINYLRENNLLNRSDVVIVITHAHIDHVGCLKKLKEKLGAKVASHINEAIYVRGEKYIGKYRYEPVEVDLLLRNSDVLYNRFSIIHTPGHTPGSICIYDSLTKSLFPGDLVYEENGELYEIPKQYSLDPLSNRRQIRNILELNIDFENILVSHGKPIIGNGLIKWRILVNKLENELL